MIVVKQVHRIIRNESGKVIDRIVVRPRGHNLLNEREYQYAIKRARRKGHETETRVFIDKPDQYFRAYRIVRENGRRTAHRIAPGGREVFGLAARQFVERRARRHNHEVIYTRAHRPVLVEIVGRTEWGARPAKSREVTPWMSTTPIRVHHSVSRISSERPVDEVAFMRSIQQAHLNKGWADIGYNYVIMPSGRVYIGRGRGVVGAHTAGHNKDIGICFAGDFRYDKLTPKAKRAFHDLRKVLGASEAPVFPHSATSATTCPAGIKKELGI